jgi:hypothetical protein
VTNFFSNLTSQLCNAYLFVAVLIDLLDDLVHFLLAELLAHCRHKVLEFLGGYIPVSVLIEHSETGKELIKL